MTRTELGWVLLLSSACASPLEEVEEREAAWWGPTDQLETLEGIELVDLPAGEPLGYWPRLTIRAEGIDFDNRAWLLSQPDEVLGSLDEEQLQALLVELDQVVELDAGVVREADAKGQIIMPLYEALQDPRPELRDQLDALGLEWPQTLVIVAEPAVPWPTIRAGIYTAGQASWMGSYTMAGDFEGRLRGVMVTQDHWGSCALVHMPLLRGDGAVLAPDGLPPLASAAGTCPMSGPAELADSLLSLQTRCAPLWQAAEQRALAQVQAQHPDVEVDQAKDWQCIELMPNIDDAATAAQFMPMLAELLAANPGVEVGPLLTSIYEGPSCAHPVKVDQLQGRALELYCYADGVEARFIDELTPAEPQEGVLGLAGLLGTKGRRRGIPMPPEGPVSSELHELFPLWAETEQKRRAEVEAAREAKRARYLEEISRRKAEREEQESP